MIELLYLKINSHMIIEWKSTILVRTGGKKKTNVSSSEIVKRGLD